MRIVDGTKLLALFDPHIETASDGKGGWIPLTSPALETALRFGEWYKPDITITGQDFMEFSPISFWNKNNRLELEGRRLAYDFEYANQILDRICRFTKEKVVFIPGNHDYWLTTYINERPELSKLIDQDKMLDFKGHGIESLRYGELYRYGKAAFAHSFLRPGKRTGQLKYHAAKMVEQYGSTIFYGHYHDHQVFTRITWDTKPHMGVGIGCLSSLNPSWLRNCPNAFVNQILFMEFDAAGHFTFLAPVMIENEFRYNGRRFAP
jgi:hypothetical protein